MNLPWLVQRNTTQRWTHIGLLWPEKRFERPADDYRSPICSRPLRLTAFLRRALSAIEAEDKIKDTLKRDFSYCVMSIYRTTKHWSRHGGNGGPLPHISDFEQFRLSGDEFATEKIMTIQLRRLTFFITLYFSKSNTSQSNSIKRQLRRISINNIQTTKFCLWLQYIRKCHKF